MTPDIQSRAGVRWQDLRRWNNVVLRFAVFDGIGEDLFFVFDDEHPIAASEIFTNWQAHLAVRWRHVLALRRETLARRRKIATVATFRSWANQTKSLAADAERIFGRDMATAMREAAQSADATLSWASARFKYPPNDPLGFAELSWAALVLLRRRGLALEPYLTPTAAWQTQAIGSARPIT